MTTWIARRLETLFTDAEYSSTGVPTALAACLVVWVLASILAMYSCRAYADLPTVLTIVHCDGTSILSLHSISKEPNLRTIQQAGNFILQASGSVRPSVSGR